MTTWVNLVNHHVDLGFLPSMIDEHDPRPLREQLDRRYRHGGGWRPASGFSFDPTTCELSYPGDPPMLPLVMMTLRDEILLVFPHDFVGVVQADNSIEICRMD
jgi:hypothetical protein